MVSSMRPTASESRLSALLSTVTTGEGLSALSQVIENKENASYGNNNFLNDLVIVNY